MRGATWPRSPASTTYCGRRINSTTEAVARNRSARPRVSTVPSAPIRSGWDITWLPGPARGLFYYLYLVMDLYSRKIVGWEIHECEASDLTAWLVRRACLVESIASQPLVLHSNNGSPMKGASMLETLHQLGVASSFSPRVSNDNAYAESLFRTCKYRPDYPASGFATVKDARAWVLSFSRWYNTEHKHSGLKFTTPEQRHTGEASVTLEHRQQVYREARARHPNRWSEETRNWELPEQVWLNPVKSGCVS